MPKSSSFTEEFQDPHPGSPFRPGEPSFTLNDVPLNLIDTSQPPTPTTPRVALEEADVTDERASTISGSNVTESASGSEVRAETRSLRSTRSRIFDEIKHEVMVNHIYQQQCSQLWIDHNSPANAEGVLIRRSKGHYLACPPQLINSTFAAACSQLNLQAAMTVNSRVIKAFVQSSPKTREVPLKAGLRIQILPDMHHLPLARKYHFAAFLAAEELLIVWDDNASNLIARAQAIESALTELVWGNPDDEEDEEEEDEKNEHQLDPESGDPIPEERPTNLINTILVAFTLIIVIVLLGLAARSLAVEFAVDRSFVRLAFLSLVPVQIFFTLVSFCPSQGHPANRFSSSRKSSWAVLHSVLGQLHRCRPTASTTRPSFHHACGAGSYPILPCSALSTRKVLHLSLHRRCAPSNKLSQPMSCKAALPICSSTMMVCRSSPKKRDKPERISMLTITLAGLHDRSTTLTVLYGRASSRRPRI